MIYPSPFPTGILVLIALIVVLAAGINPVCTPRRRSPAQSNLAPNRARIGPGPDFTLNPLADLAQTHAPSTYRKFNPGHDLQSA